MKSYLADAAPDDNPLGLTKEVQSSLIVNGLTEDNLPYYTEFLMSQRGASEALREWVGQWTAEEDQHKYLIRAWIEASRAVDPSALNADRRVQMKAGIVPRPEGTANTFVYTSLQEKATNIAHRNTGRKLGKDHKGAQAMAVIAGDEQNHHNFYRGVADAGFRISPSRFVIAAAEQVGSFDMPGTGIPRFKRHAARIALAGIYGTNEFVHGVVEPTLESWKLWDIDNSVLSDEAKVAREGLVSVMDDYREKAREEEEKRQRRTDKAQVA